MTRSFSEIEKKFADLENRFSEIENMNQLLGKQAKEYFLLFDSTRKLRSAQNTKKFFKELDYILHKSFKVDEYALILKHKNSEFLTVFHSLGLPKREMKEIFYRPGEGIAGKVFLNNQAVYIPDVSALKGFSYYFNSRNAVYGSLYYHPVLDDNGECLGLLKMRKVAREGFSEVERSAFRILQHEIGSTFLSVQKLDILHTKSFMDQDTSLYNHHYFKEHYPIEFKRAQRYQHDLSIVMLNINDLQKIKDQFLHTQILKDVGGLLRETTRTSDICIRNGENEFVILLPETSRQAAYEVAAKLNKAITDFYFNKNGEYGNTSLTLAIGVASYPADTIEPHLLVEIAQKSRKNPQELEIDKSGSSPE